MRLSIRPFCRGRRTSILDPLTPRVCLLAAVLLTAFASPTKAGLEEAIAALERGDYEVGGRELASAALAGDPSAQAMVGSMYYDGLGVAQDYALAAKWFHLAAEQGLAVAQSLLGKMYYNGAGVPQNHVSAANWLRRAAGQDDASAQALLGLMHHAGQGVLQDHIVAYIWLNLAADRMAAGDHRDAVVKLRDLVAGNLGQAELAKAQRMAGDWRPTVATAPFADTRTAGRAAGAERSSPSADQDRPLSSLRVKLVQAQLVDQGYDSGPIDGIMGPKTRAAIRAFQADVGLPVDGRISEALNAALSEAASGGRSVAAPPAAAEPRLESTGTGFVASRNGHVLTNHHVVDACTEVRVGAAGQDGAAVAVMAWDSGNDLALLGTPLRLPQARFRDGRGIRAGEDVVAVGFPLHGLLASEANVTTGTVSALAGIGNDTRFLQMSVPLQPGNSGGPLLDGAGHVVGIAVGKLDAVRVADATGDIPQNVNFAIKASLARSFLDANGVDYESARSAEELGAAEVGDRAKAFTVLVECWR